MPIWAIATRRGRPPILLLAPMVLLMGVHPSAEQATGMENTVMRVRGGTIDINLPADPMQGSSKDLLRWIQDAANAVTAYYGHFPVPHLTLEVRSRNGSGVGHGVTYPRGLIRITVGKDVTVDELKDDWTLTHEMTHLAFPNMPEEQHWIEEGLATYVEPVARAQVGQLPAIEVWGQFIRDMPKGEPRDGDEGLDHTPTWGRTYWGGAMFCLLADVRIRERTHNRKGLQDALRAILDQGGSISEDLEITKAFAIGDKATGTRVLGDLYRQMSDKPSPVDLPELWDKLGLSLNGGHVVFNDQAVDAAIRKTITSPRHDAHGRD